MAIRRGFLSASQASDVVHVEQEEGGHVQDDEEADDDVQDQHSCGGGC